MAILDRSYVDVPKLVQKYLKQIKWLETRLRQARPKEGLPSTEWIAMLCRVSKIVVEMQREDRQTKAANRAEELTDLELIQELEPILIKAGWRKPLKSV